MKSFLTEAKWMKREWSLRFLGFGSYPRRVIFILAK
jgi:hypothetical protein